MIALIASDDTVMRVAFYDGQVTGYIYAQSRAFSESALTRSYRALYIHHICVWDEFRRRGIASALVNAVREFAAESYIERRTADLWEFDAEARALFEVGRLAPYGVRLGPGT
jgi:GNAT superfamily N-acetyltransferase